VDPTVIHQPAAKTTQSYIPEPPAWAMADDQLVVGDIPAQRTGFQPRPALLRQLNRAGQEPRAAVLTGTWGAGKTQLAAAYARAKLAGGWRLIAWVDARDRQRLLAGMAAVAEATGLPDGGPGPGTADAGQAVRSWLEADGRRCLLVFDDVEDPGLLRPLVPAVGAARILITAAREPVAELGTSMPVDLFTAEEAVAFLDGRTGLADEAGAAAVAAELGHLPLALDQAAAVIAGQHLGYEAYLAKLRTRRAEDQLEPERRAYPPGAAEAVQLSLEAVRAGDPLGVCTGVVELMAVLSPAAVGRDVLRAAGQAGSLLGGGRRVAAPLVDQALARLEERSLLGFSLDGEAVSGHCLVARVVREGLARRGRLTTECRAAAAVLEAHAGALVRSADHTAVREMLGQITALLENAEGLGDDADLAAMLVRLRFLALNARDGLATAYHAAGRTADAIPLVQQILAAREGLLGADHPSTLTARNNLASAYRTTGRPAAAIPLFEENVAACERLLGADHPKTLTSRRSLDLARQESARA
jgi:tetratricopeptide (TPR) repeat protein